MAKYKPYLATDWDAEKQKFPCGIMPKIDGVRGQKPLSDLVGRSLKAFANLHVAKVFKASCYDGMDGELAAGNETDFDLCRKTSSATGTIAGEYIWTWHVFDLCEASVRHLPYKERYDMLKAYVDEQHLEGEMMDVKVVPLYVVNTMEELLEWENTWLDMGYEGVIIRDLDAAYKWGRSTQREGGYLRIKRFTDGEGEIIRIIEGSTNENEAQINDLGQTYRTSHQENMIPNGMVGSFDVKVLTVPEGLEAFLEAGQEMRVGAGRLTHEERKYYFEHPDEFLGKISKWKFFAHGMKEKLRIPTHQSFRDPADMSK